MSDSESITEKEDSLQERLEAMLLKREFVQLRHLLSDAEVADIGEVVSRLPYETMLILFRLSPREKRSDIFAYLNEEAQGVLVQELPELVVTSFVNEMDSDDRTRLIDSLPDSVRSVLLAKLAPRDKERALRLLSYPENSVGRFMSTEFVALTSTMSIQEAMAYVRWRLAESQQEIDLFYVIDRQGWHLGEIKPSALIAADPLTQLIDDVCKKTDIQLSAFDDRVVAVDMFRKYDRASFPVVDQAKKLIGYVTFDDVFDVAEEEATEDIQRFGGQENLEDSYFRTSIPTLMRKRAGWLALLLFGQLFTGTALRMYDMDIAKLGFVVFFLPLMLSAGGNSGSQAASIIIRGLAVREMNASDWKRIFFRELITGVGLGTMLGVMGMGIAAYWGYPLHVRLTVFLALLGVVTTGATLGSMMPIMIKSIKQDPAVSSSPFIASILDFVGVMIFINIALWLASALH